MALFELQLLGEFRVRDAAGRAVMVVCQRRSKNTSVGRSKNTSAGLARGPKGGHLLVGRQSWIGLSAGVSERARRERRLL